METLHEKIKKAIKKTREGKIVNAKQFAQLGNRAAIDQTLRRLANSGELMRISRGLYVSPVKGTFGNYPPAAEKVVRSLAKVSGESIVPHGAVAALNFGLSTQVPVRRVYLTSGKNSKLTLGKRSVELKHAPKWQTVLPETKAGEAVRAISYVGKAQAKETAKAIKNAMTDSEWRQLSSVKSQLPSWVVEALAETER